MDSYTPAIRIDKGALKASKDDSDQRKQEFPESVHFDSAFLFTPLRSVTMKRDASAASTFLYARNSKKSMRLPQFPGRKRLIA
jgi:hypothetical protein